jgi:hypothetical protein
MENLALKNYGYPEARQAFGTVVAHDGAFFCVETDSGYLKARRAMGCIVEPIINDMVLAVESGSGRGYILSVLERQAGTKTTVSFDGDVDITTTKGRLGIAASEELVLAGTNTITMVSSGLGVTAGTADISIERLSFWGTLFEGTLESIRLVAGTFDSILQRLYQRAKRSYRFVEETDQVRAGNLNYRADQSLILRGTFSQLTARDDVHIDGERVNIG